MKAVGTARGSITMGLTKKTYQGAGNENSIAAVVSKDSEDGEKRSDRQDPALQKIK